MLDKAQGGHLLLLQPWAMLKESDMKHLRGYGPVDEVLQGGSHAVDSSPCPSHAPEGGHCLHTLCHREVSR